MLRILALLLVVVGITISLSNFTSAQDFRIGIGARVADPMGDVDEYYPAAVGGMLRFEYQLLPKFFVNVNTGFIEYKFKDNSPYSRTNSTMNDVPLIFGAKVFYWNGFYIQGEIGLHFVERKLESNFDPTYKWYHTETSEGIGLGYEMNIAQSFLIDIGVKYTFWEAERINFDNAEVGMIISYAL